jgi:KaiC/GvpD/RAD55 family RecA-like ATPase
MLARRAYGGDRKKENEKMIYISNDMTREEVLKVWQDNSFDLIDAMIDADVDPDKPETKTQDIIDVIRNWIEVGDECAGVA